MKNLLLFSIASLLLMSCRKNNSDESPQFDVQVRVQPMAGASKAVVGNTYTNAFGENFELINFQFYISEIKLMGADGTEHSLPTNVYLVNARSDSSQQLVLPQVKAGNYQSISFLLGVDSARNVSGVQAGALDPMNGMFWTWNSGYIMAKLEGRSSSSPAQANLFSWHVGGFRTGQSVLRRVNLALPSAVNGAARIDLEANLQAWFTGASDLRIAQDPICHMPGALAMRIAANYAYMFRVQKVSAL